MLALRLAGLALTLLLVLVAVGWAVTSGDPRGAIRVLGIGATVAMAVVLVATLHVDRRRLTAYPRSVMDLFGVALMSAIGISLALSGLPWIAASAVLGVAVRIVVWFRSAPREEAASHG